MYLTGEGGAIVNGVNRFVKGDYFFTCIFKHLHYSAVALPLVFCSLV
jgi:hypothetical protein